MWQKDVIDKLKTSLEVAELKMLEAAERNDALDNIKDDLESEDDGVGAASSIMAR